MPSSWRRLGAARAPLWLAVAALATGALVLLYRGPGRAVVRGHVSDVAATALVYALLWLGPCRRSSRAVRAALAMAVATAIELGQTWWTGRGLAGELVLGSTFDAWDFVAYAVGVVLAWGYDRTAARGTGARSPVPAVPE